MKKVRTYIRRSIIALLILCGLIVAGLIGIVYFYGDQVKETLLGQLNKRLETEISVGEIELDLFRNFPQASLRFKDVASGDNRSTGNHQLIKAGEVALLFNLVDILRGRYTIERLKLQNAFLNLRVDAEGKKNFGIFNSDDHGGKGFEINLQRVGFTNVEISYQHYASDQEYLFRIDDGLLRGVLSAENQDLTFDGQIYFTQLRSGHNTFLKNRELKLFTHLVIDRKMNLVRFTESELHLNGIHITSSGEVDYSKGGKNLMLDIRVNRTPLKNVIGLIPPEYLEPIKDYDLEGNVDLSGRITGNFSKNNVPRLDVDFYLENGSFSYRNDGFRMEEMSFSGHFTNGSTASESSYQLTIDSLAALTSGGSIFGSLKIEDFSRPSIQTTVNTVLPLETVAGWLALDTIERVSGTMELDLTFSNRLKTFRRFTIDDFISSQTTGRMIIHDMDLKLKNNSREFHSISGKFGFNNKDLLVERFEGNIGRSDFSMNGFFRNILAYAFLPGESLFIDADLHSSRLNLDEILESGDKEKSNEPVLQFSDRVNYRLDVKIDAFFFRKFHSINNSGQLIQQSEILTVRNTRIHSMDGDVLISGSIDGRNAQLYYVDCQAQFNNVSVNKLFGYFGDFGQKKLTSENLKGRVDADVKYRSTLTSSLFVDQKSVYTLADVTITNGELIGYKPLEKLSKYVRNEEFSHVRFSTLKNRIRIEKEVIHIPEMDIESDRMNVTLYGEHTFQNEIDYHLQLILAEMIARKTTIEEDMGDNFVEQTNEGKTRLYLSMSGSADNPVIRYDGQAVRNKIAADLKNEREEFKSLIRKEFGNSSEKQSGDPIQTDPGGSKDFTIDWEEARVPGPARNKTATPGKKETKKRSGQKDFIISWEEEQDTINRDRR